MRPTRRRRRTLVALVGALLGAFAVGAVVLMATSDPDRPLLPSEVPIPALDVARWVDRTGRFVVPPYDDRALSGEAKAADPVVDPRWAPFAQCMATAGVSAVSAAHPFVQQDMDALVERVNASRPDVSANRDAVRSGVLPPGLARTFVDCANAWLTLSPEQVDALGLRD